MANPRYELGRKVKERDIYSGTFVRIGKKKAGGLSVLLYDVTDGDGHMVADHVWISYTEGSKKLGWLSTGDRLQFTARVRTYRKSSGMLDYRLSHPTQFCVVGRVSRVKEYETV